MPQVRWFIDDSLSPEWQAAIREVVLLVNRASARRVKKACDKRWTTANREHRRQKAREVYARRRDYYVAKASAWRRANPEKHRAACDRYAERNPYYWLNSRARRRARATSGD